MGRQGQIGRRRSLLHIIIGSRKRCLTPKLKLVFTPPRALYDLHGDYVRPSSICANQVDTATLPQWHESSVLNLSVRPNSRSLTTHMQPT
jgi:hypothetical protein